MMTSHEMPKHAKRDGHLVKSILENTLFRKLSRPVTDEHTMIPKLATLGEPIVALTIANNIILRITIKQKPRARLIRKVALVKFTGHHAVIDALNKLPVGPLRQILHTLQTCPKPQWIFGSGHYGRMPSRHIMKKITRVAHKRVVFMSLPADRVNTITMKILTMMRNTIRGTGRRNV